MRFHKRCCCNIKIVLLGIASQLLVCCYAWMLTTNSFGSKQHSAIYSTSPVRYNEDTETEDSLKKLWEANPFSTAKYIIDVCLAHNNDSLPLLSLAGGHPISYSTEYDELFRPLYSNHTNENAFVIDLPPSTKHQNDKFHHFLLRVAYRGEGFCGWQRQPQDQQQPKPSVQKLLEDWLAVLDKRKVNIRVCGRTDSGVSALGQVCRFRTRQKLDAMDVYQHLHKLPSSSIRTTQVRQVTRAFHPTFSANCRAYTYLIDVNDSLNFGDEKMNLLNEMLQVIEGRELSYIGLSYGKLKSKTALCTLYHARARLVQTTNQTNNTAICIELVGDRFLRRMVRLLVYTAMKLAMTNSDPCSLLRYVEEHNHTPSYRAAPSDGLIFVGALFNAT